MKLEGLSLIGASKGSSGGSTFTAINPVDCQPLEGTFHSASLTEVSLAAQLAEKAFLPFSAWSGAERAGFLRLIATALETSAPAIVARAHQETALPLSRLEGEVGRTCFQLRLCADAAEEGLCVSARIDHADPERKPLPKPDLRSMMRPLGPVVVFGASNFPLAFSVAGGDTAAAFGAGCPVVVKAHSAHPGTSEMVGRIIQRAVRESGAPAGVFSLIFDSGHEAGSALVKHPSIKAVGFTGSRRGGRALMDLAAARPEPIPVYAEMSSINPLFLLTGAVEQKAEEIASGLHSSVTLGVGQFCTNPGLVFVESGIGADILVSRLQHLMESTPPGTMLTQGIRSAYQDGIDQMAYTPGVKCLAAAAKGQTAAGASAALFATDFETFASNPKLLEEVFGPSTLLVKCHTREQILKAAHLIEGQLTTTIHALPEELERCSDLIEILSTKAGRLGFNNFPTGVEVAHAMTHGGPYPATSDGRSTSVGTRAIERFLRPVSYQNFPDNALPPELQESNPLQLLRLVDGQLAPLKS